MQNATSSIHPSMQTNTGRTHHQTAFRGLRFTLLAALSLLTVISFSLPTAMADDQPKKLPPFADIEKLVASELAGNAAYHDGGLITRGDVEPILAKLKALGWSKASADAVLAQTVPDDDPLAIELRASRARTFVPKSAQYPLAFDRLDRLMRLPNGRRTVHDLIGAADGYKMIEYMTTTHGGAEMGKMLSNAPHGADFNAATSRIYTANQLLAEIKKNYQQSATGKSAP